MQHLERCDMEWKRRASSSLARGINKARAHAARTRAFEEGPGSITWCCSTHLSEDYDSVPTGRVGFGADAQMSCTPHKCLVDERKRLHTHTQ